MASDMTDVSNDRTYADDFHITIKQLSQKFRDRVLPLHLLPYLECLEIVDEEVVRARHKEMGDILSADCLFEYITSKPNWLDDLVRALKEPNVGLADLAEEFEQRLKNVQIHWDIISWHDTNGIACFNGHCCHTTADLKTGIEENDDNTSVKPISDVGPEIPKQKSIEEIEIEREDLKNRFIERALSLLQGPKDVKPVTELLEKFGQVCTSVEKGSIVFTFRIESLDQLKQLQELWRFGALKKLLDKELLSYDMIKEFEKEVSLTGLSIHSITSEVIIQQADIERCKSWLKQASQGYTTPVDVVDGLSLYSDQRLSDPVTAAKKQALSRYANARLPGCMKEMIEDPFLAKQIDHFYTLPELHEKMKADLDGSSLIVANLNDNVTTDAKGNLHGKSVAEIFLAWLQEEVRKFGRQTGDIVLKQILQVAALVFLSIQKHKIATLPLSFENADNDYFEKECMEVVEGKVCYKIQSSIPGLSDSLLDFIDIPSVVNVETESLSDIFQSLSAMGIMYRHQEGYRFVSTLLRDMFLSKFVPLKDVTQPGYDTGMYPFILQVFGFEKSRNAFVQSKHSDNRFTSGAKEGISPPEVAFYKGRDEFYIPDMIKINELNKEDIYIEPYSFVKRFTADISKASYGDADDDKIRNALHCINFLCSVSNDKWPAFCLDGNPEDKMIYTGATQNMHNEQEQLKYITLNGQSLSKNGMQQLSRMIEATPSLTKLNLHDCKLAPLMLTDNLITGNFEHISHLDISDNHGIGKALQGPLGLKFLPNMHTLEIQNCCLGDKGIALLADDLRYVQKLRVLNVSQNSMTDKGLMDLSMALADCTGIISLRLQKSNIGHYGSIILAKWLKKLVLLEVLNISDCCIDDNGIELVTKSMTSKSLLKLSMRSNTLRSHTVFENTMKATLLNHFDYSETPVYGSNDGLKVSEEVADDDLVRKHLQHIGANRVKQQDAFEQFLQGSFKWYHLSFWKCSLGNRRVFQTVEKYNSLTNLSHLCLQENHITDDFVNDLSACLKQFCKVLSHLNLRQNQINNTGIESLAPALKDQKHLSEIFLDRNSYSDEGAGAMVNCCLTLPSLTILDMSCNYISKGMVSETVKLFKATLTAENEPNAFIIRKIGDTTCVEGYM